MSNDTAADLALFDQFGVFELMSVELSHCVIHGIVAGGAPDSSYGVNVGCPNVICSPGNLTCGEVNVCISNVSCIPNTVC